MLNLDVNPILNLKGIQRKYTYLRQNGFSNHKIRYFLNGNSSSVKLNDIEKLCTILGCTPNDLFDLKLNSDEDLPAEHPLRSIAKEERFDITGLTTDMSLAELIEFSRRLKEVKREIKTGE